MRPLLCIFALLLGGCAHLEFHDRPTENGLTYYDPVPFALTTVSADCTVSVQVVNLPAVPRSVQLRSGLGQSKLAVTLSNGMIASINQEGDAKVSDLLTAGSGALKTAKDMITNFAETGKATASCEPSATLTRVIYQADPNGDALGIVSFGPNQLPAPFKRAKAPPPVLVPPKPDPSPAAEKTAPAKPEKSGQADTCPGTDLRMDPCPPPEDAKPQS